MSISKRGLLVFTDLDGTLLDDKYNLVSASQAMDRFTTNNSIVIPASSKTLQELHQINELRKQPSPLIFENGAGIAYPTTTSDTELPYRVEGQGPSYTELCTLLDQIRSTLKLTFEGFHDLSAEQIAMYTGLSTAAAHLAKQRLFSEPIRWLGTPEEQLSLQKRLQQHDLQLVSGGRFLHVMPMTNKGIAATSIASTLDANKPIPRWRIACGDSDNDIPLLSWADAIVLFPQRNGEYLKVDRRWVQLATAPGPSDWIQNIEISIQNLALMKG